MPLFHFPSTHNCLGWARPKTGAQVSHKDGRIPTASPIIYCIPECSWQKTGIRNQAGIHTQALMCGTWASLHKMHSFSSTFKAALPFLTMALLSRFANEKCLPSKMQILPPSGRTAFLKHGAHQGTSFQRVHS